MKVKECTGACCREFFLPLDERGLKDAVSALRLSSQNLRPNGVTIFNDDLALWANVLEFVRPSMTTDGYPAGYWRCLAWDESTRLCRIYEQRPKTCRTYPGGDVCGHCSSKGEADAE